MTFLTVEECVRWTGVKRDLLHEFDHILRDALHAALGRARDLNLADGQIDAACVTVMLTVAASAALAGPETPDHVQDEGFSALARNAMGWARAKAKGKAKAKAKGGRDA